ncbi:PAS domain-containing protein [Actinomycetospora rhizophila]|uniref:PAS domain-containing protein n=1 Tax=Actinomycetospora rhizophila TaxID=1416876 RepID=A0ABV9ZES1_9PSEU
MRVGRVGTYSWQPRTDRWTWNATMFRLHGYEPEAVTPTRSLWVAHKHPDSLDHAREAVDEACRSHSTYVCEHRIVAFDGREREVVALGFPTPDTPRSSAGRRGYLIDVTPGAGEEKLDPVRPGWWSVRPIRDEEAAHHALAALDEHLHLSPEGGLALLEWLAVARARSVDAVAGGVLTALGEPWGSRHPRRALLAVVEPDLLPPPDR